MNKYFYIKLNGDDLIVCFCLSLVTYKYLLNMKYAERVAALTD